MCAALVTIAINLTLIGRYRPGEHPLWSFFVWRDEIVNTSQEQLAGGWLLRTALATPLLSLYLRTMGARVGRDVWCESLNLTEFDVAELGDGCAINRQAVVETHLFHDRLMRIGPATLSPGATLGPATAMLPDTSIGAGCRVGGRSVVMRGEQLPAHTNWHGAPVLAVCCTPTPLPSRPRKASQRYGSSMRDLPVSMSEGCESGPGRSVRRSERRTRPRSYRHPYALVSWHTDPVGIDIERVEPCDAAFARSICTPAERVDWATRKDPPAYFSSLWSSKEALVKALGDALGYDPRRVAAPMLWPAGRAGAWHAAPLPVARCHVAWLCWRS